MKGYRVLLDKMTRSIVSKFFSFYIFHFAQRQTHHDYCHGDTGHHDFKVLNADDPFALICDLVKALESDGQAVHGQFSSPLLFLQKDGRRRTDKAKQTIQVLAVE